MVIEWRNLFCQLSSVHVRLFKVDPFCVIYLPPTQHHDDGGAPEVPAEEMSSGV